MYNKVKLDENHYLLLKNGQWAIEYQPERSISSNEEREFPDLFKTISESDVEVIDLQQIINTVKNMIK